MLIQKAICLLLCILILKLHYQQITSLIQNKKNVCCILCFSCCFSSGTKLNRIIIQRSYSNSFEELTTIKYLNDDQMKFIDLQNLNQLKDIATDVSKRKCKNAVGQMFCVGTVFVKKALLQWLIINLTCKILKFLHL